VKERSFLDWDEVDDGAALEDRRRACQGVSTMPGSRRYRLQQDSQDPGWKNRRARRKCVGVEGPRESPDVGAYPVAA